VLLAGEIATALATTLAGGAIGAAAGSLIGALVGLGIPEEQAKVYNERVSRGEYLVLVDGNADELARAEAILMRRGIQYFGIYDKPDNITTRAEVVDASTITSASVDYGQPSTTSVEPTRTVYPGSVTSNDPKVIIVDHRDEKL
jgi:hypothetical protein